MRVDTATVAHALMESKDGQKSRSSTDVIQSYTQLDH
jgi:hypothetical protein